MKKLILLTTALLGTVAASQAGVGFDLRANFLPQGNPIIGQPVCAPAPIISTPAVACDPAPAPVYAPPPAPICSPSATIVTPAPICPPAAPVVCTPPVVVTPHPAYRSHGYAHFDSRPDDWRRERPHGRG